MSTQKCLVLSGWILAVLFMGLDAGLAQYGPNPEVDYSKPNYANSPILRKFVNSLPGLGAASSNNLGQYIPVAVPDTTTYPGSDYYVIGLQDHTEQMHSDLPATKIRGYRQLNTADPAVSAPHYLGPLIVAQRDRPVRILFTNMLANGEAGNLFIPVDTTLMGAGIGPGVATNNLELYKQNRATLHLHGGFTPWISDGTPHQWTTPAGEATPYPRGVSTQNVPDMPAPGEGAMTFYYPNQQSARMQFYHDHALGITRLNVYAGEVAGYLITDPVEQSLIDSGIIPSSQIPLIIQDKTFVPDADTLDAKDPLWDTEKWGGMGSLWFPHVYIPNQDPTASDGANPFGRWDYGPWFWPIFPASEPLPAISCVPEGYMDTPVINGTAYPYLTVEPKAYRFRILNGCNDRFINLQLYYVDPDDPNGTEVKMVPALPTTNFPAVWPTDNREGGVPDPTLAGPNMIVIGNEGGILPAPTVITNTPIGYLYDRRNIVVLNVSTHGLFLGPAERADVIIDFSQVPPGSKLILYNDAPAPVPAFDPRNDFYTGDPDLTENGGAPTTVAGYGPNTRTIMQIRVEGVWHPAYNYAALETALPLAFSASQPAPIVSQGVYARIQDTALLLTNHTQSVGSIILTAGGAGYTSSPTVTVTSGGGSGAAAIAKISGVTAVTLTSGGSNYVSAPSIAITGGGGTGVVAFATISTGSVTTITVTDGGSSYTSTPTVVITGGGGTNATATATITRNAVTGIQITNPGSGYTFAPDISFYGGAGAGAVAFARLAGAIPMQPKTIQELFETHGRMNATLGIELPFTTAFNQTTIPLGYIDPATETIPMGETQLWKITHNGVDTHAVHFHLVNVQVINRVGWDGQVRMPDPEEMGWKETVKMNPLEDIIVALQTSAPKIPFAITNSVRPLAPTLPLGTTAAFTGIDTNGNPTTVANVMTDFGWEYVWHCHLLGHEENDMMRPFVMTAVTNYIGTTNFVAPAYLDINIQPTNTAGSVVALPDMGTAPYASGTVVTLTAFPNAPYKFVSWSGSITGITSPRTLTMDTFKSVTANFAPTGNVDIAVTNLVFLPVTATNLSHAGLVSLRLRNNGPDDMVDSPVRFDFFMVSGTNGAVSWIGENQQTLTLDGDADEDDECLVVLDPGSRTNLTIPRNLEGRYQPQVRMRHLAALADPNLSNDMVNGIGTVTVRSSGLNSSGRAIQNDYDGDGISDYAVYDEGQGRWYVTSLNLGGIQWELPYGGIGMIPVEGDYDGDGVADYAVYNETNGTWFIENAYGEQIAWNLSWGGAGFKAVPGDYDGDGKSDMALFDSAAGTWYIIKPMQETVIAWAVQWGWPNAVPVSGDFDGDGIADMAVFDSNSGNWYIRTVSGVLIAWADQFGWSKAVPAGGDFDGDGIADMAVFDSNSGYWYIKTASGSVLVWAVQWGWQGAIPMVGDYDGDGTADMAVFDSNSGYWYIRTVSGTLLAWADQWGWPGATAVGSGH